MTHFFPLTGEDIYTISARQRTIMYISTVRQVELHSLEQDGKDCKMLATDNKQTLNRPNLTPCFTPKDLAKATSKEVA